MELIFAVLVCVVSVAGYVIYLRWRQARAINRLLTAIEAAAEALGKYQFVTLEEVVQDGNSAWLMHDLETERFLAQSATLVGLQETAAASWPSKVVLGYNLKANTVLLLHSPAQPT